MANTIAVSVIGDVKDINNKLGSVDKQLSGFGASANKLGGQLKSAFALGAVVGGIKSLAGVLGETISAARESAKVTALTENVIKTMGNAAGISATGVASLATAISNKTGVDDEAIQSGANLVLTFGNIKNAAGAGNDIFSQTVGLANDMSVALGQDMKTSSLQLGKALNDPVKGVTALSKAGVSFTAQQKEQIKTLQKSGDTLGAQKIILGEVQKQFGGAAAAAATPWDKLKTTLGNLQEEVGAKLIPVVDKLINDFLKNLPGYVDTAKKAWDGLKGAFDAIQPVLTTIFNGFKSAASFLLDHTTLLKGLAVAVAGLGAAYVAYKTVMLGVTIAQNAWNVATGIAKVATVAWTVAQAALNIVMALNPITLVVIAIVALIAIIVILWNKNEGFRNALIAAWNAIKSAAVTVWNAIKSAISTAINAVKTAVESTINKIKSTWTTVWNAIKAFISNVWNGIKSGVTTAFDAVKTFIATRLNNIKTNWTTAWNAIKTTLVTVWNGIKTAVSTAIDAVVKLARDIKSKVLGAITGAATWLYQMGKDVVQGLIDGIGDMFGTVVQKAKDLAGTVSKTIKDALKIGSPSKVMVQFGRWTSEGLALGIKDSIGLVTAASGSLSKAAVNGYGGGMNGKFTNTIANSGTAAPITLNVTAPVGSNAALIGKELVNYLDAHNAVYGKRWMN